MRKSLHGIHHITAISSDPQANFDFYTKLLGLRMVKQTVNYDDPTLYHLYFGDASGSPGSILTFFPFPDTRPGRVGTGQVASIGYSIPAASVDFWVERLSRGSIHFNGPVRRFDQDVISFADSDGLPLELVADSNHSGTTWTDSSVPAEHAIKRFSSATLLVSKSNSIADLLTNVMGFREVGVEANRTRFVAGDGDDRQFVDVVLALQSERGFPGPGTVHHIAWRCLDIDHKKWREIVADSGFSVTPIIDRNYFHSIYFREHGGILFEIASDEPGFLVDQSEYELGSALSLPPWLESKRETIERRLPPLSTARSILS